jgi:hypothetical protein
MPVRIQRKRTPGWRMPPGTIYVGRGTPFGNPLRVTKCKIASGPDAGKPVWMVERVSGAWFFDTKAEALAFAVTAFATWVNHPAQSRLREIAKLHLRGRDLACWCGESDPCHADIWLEIANQGVVEHA